MYDVDLLFSSSVSPSTVLVGEIAGIKSPMQTLTPTRYLAYDQQPGAKVTQRLPHDWNAFIYVIKGTVAVGMLTLNRKLSQVTRTGR